MAKKRKLETTVENENNENLNNDNVVTLPSNPPKKNKRAFDAARLNRLTASWSALVTSINDDIKCDLLTLRSRSNDLAQNDPLIKKWLDTVERNVVGSQGFQLQSKVKDSVGIDHIANDAIESHFDKWSSKPEVTGRLSLPELSRLVVRSVARDGEVLIRHIFNESTYGYQVQLISANRLAFIDREAHNNQNAILSGVEIDSWGRPIAYHLYKDKCLPASPTIRVSASEISHIYVQEYPEQVRGIPWAAAVMTRIHILKKYIEFALVASAVGASKMGFYTTPTGDLSPLAEEDEESGEFIQQAVAGEFGVLPPGYDFKSFDPDYPHQNFNDFVRSISRWIASGLGISYNLLCNDADGVSYSSIRSFIVEERDHWMTLQQVFIAQLMEPIFNNFITSALLKNKLTLEDGKSLPIAKKEKFMRHAFLGRRWSWVDPKKDAEAKILLFNSKLASPYDIAAEQGMDLNYILQDLNRFANECEKLGLKIENVSIPADDGGEE
ncbi:lambda family phage portal protein [Nitrosomonas nitrosa]|uniref:phage portal protein n=1 Tax=Nitrosomonas nitrosa TaxID=52442 RepID=UPI000D31F342|nr:phage portal protein [Nitrosomonas nitrosa]PTR04962.1 lambda family phage portal protein [Nitrosomonas nitrosa]